MGSLGISNDNACGGVRVTTWAASCTKGLVDVPRLATALCCPLNGGFRNWLKEGHLVTSGALGAQSQPSSKLLLNRSLLKTYGAGAGEP